MSSQREVRKSISRLLLSSIEAAEKLYRLFFLIESVIGQHLSLLWFDKSGEFILDSFAPWQ